MNDGPPPRAAAPRLFIECSQTWLKGGRTGIQRVVRAAVEHARIGPAEGSEPATPIVFAGCGFVSVGPLPGGPRLRFRLLRGLETLALRIGRRSRGRGDAAGAPGPGAARGGRVGRARARLLGLITAPERFLIGREVRFRPGDALLLADATWNRPDLWPAVERARVAGARVIPIVYDLLPVELPHRHPPELTEAFRAWLEWVVAVADGAVAISRGTRDVLALWAAELRPAERGALPIEVFRLGAGIGGGSDAPSARGSAPRGCGLEARAPRSARGARRCGEEARDDHSGAAPGAGTGTAPGTGAPYFLMVGTLEPRKGHGLVLDAFEELWAAGSRARLVVAGRPASAAIVEGIRGHREHGARLAYRDDASDAELADLYRGAVATIQASEGEGFGLPVVEALAHGCPVIASDIPAHREIGDGWCRFFPPGNRAALVAALAADHPRPQGFLWPDWRESAAELSGAIGRVMGD